MILYIEEELVTDLMNGDFVTVQGLINTLIEHEIISRKLTVTSVYREQNDPLKIGQWVVQLQVGDF